MCIRDRGKGPWGQGEIFLSKIVGAQNRKQPFGVEVAWKERMAGGLVMFMQIDPLWREAFALAWEAFCRGNVPVGCLIVNGAGQVVARGQNAIFDDHTVTPLAGTDLAHAEMVALSRLRIAEHNTTDYTPVSYTHLLESTLKAA